jgi:D-sedoheptulose 7-phosphate isomerase
MEKLIARYPALNEVKKEIIATVDLLCATYECGGKLLLCGNGGSAADCDHIVGELMKSFKMKRPISNELYSALNSMGEDGQFIAPLLERPVTAISLCEHNSLSTAYGNDRCSDAVFAQQLLGYGNEGDVLLALTTSGNSKNCVYAATLAKAMGIRVVSITGSEGGKIAALSDISIKLPEKETYLVQELTLPIYHYICAELEKHFFSPKE